MMRAASTLVCLCLLVGVTGCAWVPQRYQLAAPPLMEVSETAIIVRPGGPGAPDTYRNAPISPIAQVNLLVQDSQRKCSEFVNSMFAETAGSGLILDVLSTGTSAISAIITPLSTAHALAAASTVLGATKTGITANYLNTLSVSHITQAIQASYTTHMKNYIDSLANLSEAEKLKLDVFQERSKILSYHNECSLAAAEGSISSTLQTPTTSGQGLSLTHTVTAGESTSARLAAALAIDINAVFGKAGVTALQDDVRRYVINLRMTAPFKLTVSSSPTGLVAYSEGSSGGQLTVVGQALPGNTITIAGPGGAQQQQPSAAGQTAPAATAGAALR